MGEGLATEVVPPSLRPSRPRPTEVASSEALVTELASLVVPSAHPQCQPGSTEEVLARPPWQRLSWAPAMASRQPIFEGPRTLPRSPTLFSGRDLSRHPVSMTLGQLSIDGD